MKNGKGPLGSPVVQDGAGKDRVKVGQGRTEQGQDSSSVGKADKGRSGAGRVQGGVELLHSRMPELEQSRMG